MKNVGISINSTKNAEELSAEINSFTQNICSKTLIFSGQWGGYEQGKYEKK